MLDKVTEEQKLSKKQDIYIGITENELKTRYNKYTSSFRLNHKKSATTLSVFIWKLKESKTEYHLSWDVIERAQPYSAATNRCNLCIAEKYFILKTKPSLNKTIFLSSPQKETFTTKLPVARKRKKTNNTRSERQPNTPGSYPKRAEDRRHLCPPLETQV